MALNPFQVNDLNASLIINNNPSGSFTIGQRATELPLVPDNLNRQLAYFTLPMGQVDPYNQGTYSQSTSEGSNRYGTWMIPGGGDYYDSSSTRCAGGFYERMGRYVNELSNYCYLGTMLGGRFNYNYSFDQVNGGAVDYEPAYGHGVASWPMPNSYATQFRDALNLPSDGASALTYTPTWTRTNRLHPCFYLAHITQGGTIASGNIQFFLEQRPTANMASSALTSSPLQANAYELFELFPNRTTNVRALCTYLGRVSPGGPSWINTPNEDGTRTGWSDCWDANAVADFPPYRLAGEDQRIMKSAHFVINEEYYGIVSGTAMMIFSNKGNAIPLQFWDMALTWTTATAPRIGGVAVDPATMNVWLIAESGELAVLDFSVLGGQMLLKAAAPALSGGEAYGAMKFLNGVLWAVTGAFATLPTKTVTSGSTLGLTTYTLASSTWGTRTNSPIAARHNARSLDDLILTREGFLVIVAEVVTTLSGNTTNTGGNGNTSNYQLLFFNPTGATWNTNVISYGGNMSATAHPGSFWRMQTMGFVGDVASGKLLVQCGWDNDKVFVYDYSGTWTDDHWVDLSWGKPTTILPANPDGNRPMLHIIRSSTDDSVVFYVPAYAGPYNSNAVPPIWRANPGVPWDGTKPLMVLNCTNNDGTSTTAVAKDSVYFSQFTTYVWGWWTEAPYPCLYSDNQLTFFRPGKADYTPGPYYGYGLYPGATTQVAVYLTQYWKWDATNSVWTSAYNWADAVANPKTVPITPGTTIPVVHGLSVSFGPQANTTFLTGEFHTLNMAYGNVKFARRARFTYTAFAGRTFQNAETRTVAQIRALQPQALWLPTTQKPVTVSGPVGISASGSGCTWPIVASGAGTPAMVLNDVPAQIIYDMTLMPPGPSAVPPMTGLTNGPVTVSASSASRGASAWNPWARQTVSMNSYFGNANSHWVSGDTGNEWFQVDFGVGNQVTIRSYMLQSNRDNYTTATSKWQLLGSNDGTTWTVLDNVTGWSWGAGRIYDNVGPCAPCLRSIAGNSAPYRFYRFNFPGGEGNYYFNIAGAELYTQDLKVTGARFTDLYIPSSGNGHPCGYGFEVDQGSGFTPITPLWSSHDREGFVFPLQDNVLRFRLTAHGGWYFPGNNALRCIPNPVFWDYGTQAQIDAARLGSSVAADNTPARGSFDSQCMGVADMMAISVDGVSPQQYNPVHSGDYDNAVLGWWNYGPWDTPGPLGYKIHPYYGFLALSPDIQGTSVAFSYSWGRRV